MADRINELIDLIIAEDDRVHACVQAEAKTDPSLQAADGSLRMDVARKRGLWAKYLSPEYTNWQREFVDLGGWKRFKRATF